MAYMTNSKAGAIEYKMTELMAEELLKTRKGDEFKMTENEFLCKVVNETFGVKCNCVRVIRH